jgi:signal transduction histidine kinase
MRPISRTDITGAHGGPLPEELRALQGGLDRLAQGVSIFDGTLRLVAWNRRFVQLLSLPESLIGYGVEFAAIVRHLAERGELGPGDADAHVARRVLAARQRLRFYVERTTREGRIVAAQTDPLPGGGFVTVYTDVTERSQAETLTQARSDELEARVNQRTLELRTANEALLDKVRELEAAAAARDQVEQALREAQKLSAIGQLAGGLAHDFNNLLTVVVGSLGALRDRLDGPLVDEYVAPGLRASYRGVDITRRLLAFARQQSLEPTAIDVSGLLAGTVQLLRRSLPSNITLDCSAEPDGWPALVDAAQLENAVVNLALNARDAMPDGGSLTIRTSFRHLGDGERGPLAAGDYVEVSVTDSGTGIAPEIEARVLEPFFTTKPFGAGSGLGLSMVFGFVRQSGGDIQIASGVGRGTTVTLLLPRAEGLAAVALAPLDDLPVAAGHGELVLLVEDHDDVRQTLRRHLLELGYQVLEARDGEDARSLLSSIPDVAILVSDIIMPGTVNGLCLADHARRTVPGIRIVLISGFAHFATGDCDWFDERRVLRKPFGKDELARALEEAAP